MSAQIPPVPDSNPTVGFVDWRDVIDNVRELDLEWLQNRTVVRFDSVGAANSYAGDPAKVPGSLEEGQVVYFIGPKQLAVKTGASTYKYALLSGLLTVADAGAIASISNAGTGGITLPADGSVGVPLLKVAVDKVVADSAGLHLKTGTATANLTTSATDLVSDIPIQAPVLKAAGAIQAASAAVSGAITAASASVGSLSASGAASVGSLAAATTITATGNVTAGGLIAPAISIGGGNVVANSTGINVVGNETISGALSAGGNITSSAGNVVANSGLVTNNLFLNSAQFQWEASTNGLIKLVPGGAGSGAWQRVSGARHRTNGVTVGTAPSTEDLYRYEPLWQAGSVVVTTDSFGQAYIPFPESFPRGCISVVVMNGDGFGPGDVHRYTIFSTSTPSNAGVTVHCSAAAGPFVASTTFRLNYIAFGW